MTKRARILGAALLAALVCPRPSLALEDDPLGLAAGARAVERAVKKARQGMFTATLLPNNPRDGRLSLSLLEFGTKGLNPDILALAGRYRAHEHLWMNARLAQPATRGPVASLGLNWETGPVLWSLSAATSRPASNGLLPGADLSGTWRF